MFLGNISTLKRENLERSQRRGKNPYLQRNKNYIANPFKNCIGRKRDNFFTYSVQGKKSLT